MSSLAMSSEDITVDVSTSLCSSVILLTLNSAVLVDGGRKLSSLLVLENLSPKPEKFKSDVAVISIIEVSIISVGTVILSEEESESEYDTNLLRFGADMMNG